MNIGIFKIIKHQIFEAQMHITFFQTMNIINKSRTYKNNYNNLTENLNTLKLEIQLVEGTSLIIKQ